MRELALRGHEIILVSSMGKTDAAEKSPGVVAEYQLPFQTINPFDKIKAYRQLAHIVEKHGIELIHAQQRTAGYFAECIFRRTGIPCVTTVHDIWHPAPLKFLHGKIFRGRLIAVSGFIQKVLEDKFAIPAEQIRVIHNGVDPAKIENVSPEEAALFRKQFGIGGEIVFSLIARLTKSKGHFDLIEALRRQPPDFQFKCLIVGEGKAKKRLQNLVRRYGMDTKVLFCGYQQNIPAVLLASDVVLLPSYHEPFGLAIVEAMLARTAVIASEAGGIPEIITRGQDGLLFPVGDVAALAGAIELLVRDPMLRQRLGEAGYRTANRKFLLTTMIDKTEAYYSEVVQSARAAREATVSHQ
jgi:glycosyltransferase involved in cell wall biosynthesis